MLGIVADHPVHVLAVVPFPVAYVTYSAQNLIMEPRNGKPELFLQNLKYLYGER